MKKIIYSIIILCSTLCLFGCNIKEENIEGNLTDLMKELYKDVSKEDVPMLKETQVNEENEEYYLGVTGIKYKEALASEPMMSSIAHSVVLIRMENINDVENAKKEILENINPMKWVCVGVEKDNVIVKSKGDLIVLIMDNEYSSLLRDNFLKLK